VRPARLRTQIFPYSLGVTLIALIGVTLYAVSAIRDLHVRETDEALLEKARLLSDLLSVPTGVEGADRLAAEPEALERRVRELGSSVRTRITVILPDGRVVADSEQAPASMANHGDRPEVRAALSDGVGRARRYSQTLDRDMLYVAVRAPRDDPAAMVVIRTALPLATLAETVADTLEHVALVGVVAGLLAAGLGLAVARRVTRPLEELTRGAEAFAGGDLSPRLAVGGSREVSDLARAMNDMAGQLGERIATIDRQRTELAGVLESMVEGVVAVDVDQRVLRLNSACLRLLGLTPAEAEGRTLREVLRNPELNRLATGLLATGEPIVGEIPLQDGLSERTLEVHGSVLREGDGRIQGAVLVLLDVTRTRRLERVRRDFVANVSHELRTPIAAVKASIETLEDGASADPEAGPRFLHLAGAEVDRLEAIVEDLLALSRVEQGQQGSVVEEPVSLREAAREALATCEAAARDKGVTLALAEGPDVTAPANRTLLIQALANLLDNAVKYSDRGTLTTVSIEAADGDALVHVTDQGQGIPAEHLPRIFERFYRVDKGRSRELGGTGLGLAIVKHIAEAHGGRVSVQSRTEQGSRFTIRLPRTPRSEPLTNS